MANPKRGPTAAVRPQTLTSAHGTRIDDYAWLRDDTRRDRTVLAQLRREDNHTERWFEPIRGKLSALNAELRARIVEHDEGVPIRRGSFEYFWRDLPGRDHPRYYRRGLEEGAAEELLLDAQRRAGGSDAYSLGDLLPSPNARYVAVTEDREGDGVYTLQIKDLQRQRWLPEAVESVDAELVWSADSSQILYVHKDSGTLAALEVRAHRLRRDPDSDRLIYRETDPAFYVSVGSSHSERSAIIHAETTRRTKVLQLPTDDFGQTPNAVSADSGAARLYYDDDGEHAWLLNDRDASNFRLLRKPLSSAAADAWEVIVEHNAEVVLEDFLPLPGALLLVERRDAQLGLRLIDLRGGEQRSWFEADGVSALTIDDNPEPDPQRIRVRRDYWQQPGEVLELDISSGEFTLIKRDTVAVDLNADDYRVERLQVSSDDGTQVPVTVLRHRDTPVDGSAPLWLNGYGAYGESLDPGFDADRLSLLERGVVIAYAHVRGGGERGAIWHDQGRRELKSNSFGDFLAVADALVAQGYAAPDRMAAVGGSAGGLLVAAAINWRPERFAAALLHVPFVDVVSSMLDESLPLTQLEYAEWGDPRNAADYHAMLSWSPYDQLLPAAFPAILATGGLHDGQVAYWEPAKYVAKARRMNTAAQPILLKIDFGAGHQGVSGRYSSLGEIAISYGFVLQMLDVW